jgi:hypothetical protein
MTTIRSLYKRPAVFRLPDLKKRKAPPVSPNMNHLSTVASEQRVLENTKVLRNTQALIARLDAFLRASKARLP